MTYEATKSGLSLDGGDEVSWGELEHALASYFHPGSSAPELRRQLSDALDGGDVSGRTDILEAVLAATDPARALSVLGTKSAHPAYTDPNGWATAYNAIQCGD